MNECSTFIHAPADRTPKAFRSWAQRVLISFFLILVTASGSFADQADKTDEPKQNKTTHLVSVSKEDWELANRTDLESPSLVIRHENNFFSRNSDVLSEIIFQLTGLSSHFKKSVVWRRFHDVLLYMDKLSLKEVTGELIPFLSTLDEKTLAEYGLLEPVEVFDFENPEFFILGISNRHLAVKPTQQYTEWRSRLDQLLKDKVPTLYAKHKAHLESAGFEVEGSYHFSLLQNAEILNSKEDIERAEAEINELIPEVRKIFKAAAKKYEDAHHAKPTYKISLKTHSLDLSIPPASIMVTGLPILSYFLGQNGKPWLSPVLSWSVPVDGTSYSKRVEFSTQALLHNNGAAYDQEPFFAGVDTSYQKFEPTSMDKFMAKISPRLRGLYEKALLKELSPSRLPSVLKNNKGQSVVTTTEATSVLTPKRAFSIFEKVSKIGLRSTPNSETGLTLYASSGDGEVQFPGDWDILASSLILVPSDAAKNKEEARKQAAAIFTKEVLGKLREKVLEGSVSIIEFRVSSKVAMGYADPADLDGYEENLFLTEVHFLDGKYTDEHGRTWTLEELIEHGDFTKFKLNFWQNGTPHEISLQFLIGYAWNGEVHPLQTQNRKGQLPLLRTGISENEDAMAINSIMHKAFILYAIQKGQVEWSAIRDLTSFWLKLDRKESNIPLNVDPVLPAKIAKKVRGFLRLILGVNPGMGQVFFKETRDILRKSGRWTEGYTFGDLYKKLLAAVNQKELKFLNDFERKVNDLRELNEGKHEFDKKTMDESLKTTAVFIERMDKLLITPPRVELPEQFLEDYRAFKSIIRKTIALDDFEKQRAYLKNPRANFHEALYSFEKQLKLVQDYFVRGKLGKQEREFIHVLISHVTHFYLRYMNDRLAPTESRELLMLKMMGIESTEANMHIMQYINANLEQLSNTELAKLQLKLFAPKDPCAALLTQGSTTRRTDPPPSEEPSL